MNDFECSTRVCERMNEMTHKSYNDKYFVVKRIPKYLKCVPKKSRLRFFNILLKP